MNIWLSLCQTDSIIARKIWVTTSKTDNLCFFSFLLFILKERKQVGVVVLHRPLRDIRLTYVTILHIAQKAHLGSHEKIWRRPFSPQNTNAEFRQSGPAGALHGPNVRTGFELTFHIPFINYAKRNHTRTLGSWRDT